MNWGRVVPQIIYYFWGYLHAIECDDERVAFAVPTGNFGNIWAGYIARQMGLPIEQLIFTTNENDLLDEFFKKGVYLPRSPAETFVTSSPSMDISKASNFERFIFDFVGRDGKEVRNLDSQASFDITEKPYFPRLSQFGFVSGKSTHADRVAAIKTVREKYEVVIDIHAADAFKVASE
jgi:threonine synthase